MTAAISIAGTLAYSLGRSPGLAITASTGRQRKLPALFAPSNRLRLMRSRNSTFIGTTVPPQLPRRCRSPQKLRVSIV